MVGLAIGNALGTTVQFAERGTFSPVTDLVGGGPLLLPPGAWSAETSMAICLARSLIACRGVDTADQLHRYLTWWRTGEPSSTGACIGISQTMQAALRHFEQTQQEVAPSNKKLESTVECLARLAPVVCYFAGDQVAALRAAADCAKTTHHSLLCEEASQFLALLLHRILHGLQKSKALEHVEHHPWQAPEVQQLATGRFQDQLLSEIRGSQNALECLEAALWCFLVADNFRDAVLLAVNLGEHAESTGAVCGQIAGAYYGEYAIPAEWRAQIARSRDILQIADELTLGAGQGG
jgi:ADP-ribosyl-[dinitrogen reductase] hydrolase